MEEKKKPAQKVAPQQASLVKVKNNTFGFFVQPSTGIRVEAKSEAEFKEDGWLRNQLSAKVMEKV